MIKGENKTGYSSLIRDKLARYVVAEVSFKDTKRNY